MQGVRHCFSAICPDLNQYKLQKKRIWRIMYIYIMRHGETYWNKDGKIQGSSDIELTDFGIELARLSADGFFEGRHLF